MKLNGNQPSVAETIDNNHLLQIQEIKIDLLKSDKQEKYSEHDVNKVFHMKPVSHQIMDYVMSEIGPDHFLVATYENMSLNATPT